MGSSQRETEKVAKKLKVIRKIKMRIVYAVLTLVIKAQAGNIIEELNGAGATTLLSLIEKAGLTSTLEGEGPFTVFAPDNMAIDALPTELVDALMADTELLKTV